MQWLLTTTTRIRPNFIVFHRRTVLTSHISHQLWVLRTILASNKLAPNFEVSTTLSVLLIHRTTCTKQKSKALCLWLQFYYSKKIWIRTSQKKWCIGEDWEVPNIKASLVLSLWNGTMQPSWHKDVWQYTKDCQVGKLTQVLIFRVFIGVWLHRHA